MVLSFLGWRRESFQGPSRAGLKAETREEREWQWAWSWEGPCGVRVGEGNPQRVHVGRAVAPKEEGCPEQARIGRQSQGCWGLRAGLLGAHQGVWQAAAAGAWSGAQGQRLAGPFQVSPVWGCGAVCCPGLGQGLSSPGPHRSWLEPISDSLPPVPRHPLQQDACPSCSVFRCQLEYLAREAALAGPRSQAAACMGGQPAPDLRGARVWCLVSEALWVA